MNDKEDKEGQQAADFFVESMEQFGVAVASVSDGFILGFKREAMQAIIDQHPNDKLLTIFVKMPTKNPITEN
jgi:hypothetical protein